MLMETLRDLEGEELRMAWEDREWAGWAVGSALCLGEVIMQNPAIKLRVVTGNCSHCRL